jgi:hypothetical protein
MKKMQDTFAESIEDYKKQKDELLVRVHCLEVIINWQWMYISEVSIMLPS